MKKYTIVWIVLVVFTLFAFLLGWLNVINVFLVIILLITTLLKGQLVIDYFMGLRDVSLRWKVIPSLWLFIVMLLIGIAYFFPVPTL